jgi:tetrahydromethanopterin S-methyltransferase subunit A
MHNSDVQGKTDGWMIGLAFLLLLLLLLLAGLAMNE